MARELGIPRTESQFKLMQDKMYELSKEAFEEGNRPSFKSLVEIASSKTVILTAIKELSRNKGSETPGTDGHTLREFFLEEDNVELVFERIQAQFNNYKPKMVRRVYIPKPGKDEFRPLGIPAIIDRVIQKCIKMVIEPILEAQFFEHSYGFRPYRNQGMAINRIKQMVERGYYWTVEGDISKCFDKVNHNVLIKRLWNMGVKDKRLLIIVKKMLKAGIMGEMEKNEMGTPQGGIISPLLANVYLDAMDSWITREWENKKTKHKYVSKNSKMSELRRGARSRNLKPVFLIRFADDWVLLTNSKRNAEKYKFRVGKFLNESLKLQLSDEKTTIINARKKAIKFLGVEIRARKSASNDKYRVYTKPDRDRFEKKFKELYRSVRKLRLNSTTEKLVDKINRVNSQIRGVIEYYELTTDVYNFMRPWAFKLDNTAYKAIAKNGGKLIEANKVHNLNLSVHSQYTRKIPSIEYDGMWIGVTSLSFCKWNWQQLMNQSETPYSIKGRELHRKRTGKKPLNVRADEMLSLNLSEAYTMGTFRSDRKLYNFEFLMNRPYAYNRDKGKCKVCGESLVSYIEFHHIQPHLPKSLVNRTGNLASVHSSCHRKIHDGIDHSELGKKAWQKIIKFREKLNDK